MPKKSILPQTPRHIPIFDEDWEWLSANYGVGSESKLGAGPAIREIVHHKVAQLRQRVIELRDQRQSRVVESVGE